MSQQSLNGLLCRLVKELVSQGVPIKQATREFEKCYLTAALEQQEGNLTRTAETLGVHRNTLRNKMTSLGI